MDLTDEQRSTGNQIRFIVWRGYYLLNQTKKHATMCLVSANLVQSLFLLNALDWCLLVCHNLTREF
jgi:hypothetical protein